MSKDILDFSKGDDNLFYYWSVCNDVHFGILFGHMQELTQIDYLLLLCKPLNIALYLFVKSSIQLNIVWNGTASKEIVNISVECVLKWNCIYRDC